MLVPLACAAVLALLLSASVEGLQRRGVPAWLGAGGLVLAPIAGVGAALALLAGSGPDWLRNAGSAASRVSALLDPLAARAGGVGAAARWLQTRMTLDLAALAPQAGRQVLEGLVTGAAAAMLLFFLLLAQRSLLDGLVQAMPDLRARRRLLGALREARRGVATYVVTVALMNFALASTCGLALAALGIPQSPVWAGIMFALLFIPYLGPLAIVALLAVAGHGSFGAAPAMTGPPLVFLALHAVEANLLSPWLLGYRLRVSRVAVLAVVLVFGWAWGLAGGVLAVPLLIVARAVLRRSPGRPVAKALLAAEGASPAALDSSLFRLGRKLSGNGLRTVLASRSELHQVNPVGSGLRHLPARPGAGAPDLEQAQAGGAPGGSVERIATVEDRAQAQRRGNLSRRKR